MKLYVRTLASRWTILECWGKLIRTGLILEHSHEGDAGKLRG